MVFQQIKMTEDTYYLKCDTLEEFNNFCREGGWNNHEEFQKATGMTFEDIQGKWFEIDDNNRIYLEDDVKKSSFKLLEKCKNGKLNAEYFINGGYEFSIFDKKTKSMLWNNGTIFTFIEELMSECNINE